jgi:hypothetical protein
MPYARTDAGDCLIRNGCRNHYILGDFSALGLGIPPKRDLE